VDNFLIKLKNIIIIIFVLSRKRHLRCKKVKRCVKSVNIENQVKIVLMRYRLRVLRYELKLNLKKIGAIKLGLRFLFVENIFFEWYI